MEMYNNSSFASLSTAELVPYAQEVREPVFYTDSEGVEHYYERWWLEVPNGDFTCDDPESTDEEPHSSPLILYW